MTLVADKVDYRYAKKTSLEHVALEQVSVGASWYLHVAVGFHGVGQIDPASHAFRPHHP